MKKSLNRALIALCLAALGNTLYAATPLQLGDGGITFDAGGLGTLTLPYPQYNRDGKNLDARVEKKVDGTIQLVYPDQITIAVARVSDRQVKFTLAGDGALKDSLNFTLHLPGVWKGQATYAVGNDKPAKLPLQLPPDEKLANGRASTLAVKADNGGFAIDSNVAGWFQLQDNRKWNWAIYQFYALINVAEIQTAGGLTLTIAPEAVTKQSASVDRYGQPIGKDFPGKITDDQQLRDEIAIESKFNSALTPPATDAFGGLPGSKEKYKLTSTGFFHLGRIGDRDVFVTPEGNAFFQLGLCTLQPGDDYTFIGGRRGTYEWLPDMKGPFATAFRENPDTVSFYLTNVIRKYDKPYDVDSWTTHNVKRARTWGFNSAGAFGGHRPTLARLNFPYSPGLPLRTEDIKAPIPGLPDIFDPFNDKAAPNMDAAFASHVAPNAGDPLIVGYFLGNEQFFEDIPKVIPMLKGDMPAKMRLVQMLKEKYSTIAAFNIAWNLSAASFDALADMPLASQTDTSHADLLAYQALFMDRYYQLITQTFKKYDRNHLLIGNRWTPRTANQEVVCAAAGRYLDVISINYYTQAFDPAFIQRVHTAAGGKRPIMLSEWSFGTSEQGLSGGVIDVKDQTERGKCYRDYVEGAVASKFVVGIQWFAYIDQALTGRYFQGYNGERMNIGIINVADKPFYDFLTEAVKTNYHIWDIAFGSQTPFRYERPGIARRSATAEPRLAQIARALPGFKLDGTANGWPTRPTDRITGAELVSGKDAGTIEADFRMCWDDKKLYMMVAVRDATPLLNVHKGEGLWSGDAVELFFGTRDMTKGGSLLPSDRQLIIGATEKPEAHFFNGMQQYACQTFAQREPDGKGYVLQVAIPFEALGVKPASGQSFMFDIGVDESSDGTNRQRQFMWNGTALNSSERGQWGRAKLVD